MDYTFVVTDDSKRVMLPLLPLKNMSQRHVGLSEAIAECYLEAARVCLDRHHTSPQVFTLDNDKTEGQVRVEWDATDERVKGAWANNDDATRDGAYACALAATELAKGFVAVRRAETRTGADYYVAPADNRADDLENCYRLEVSGTNGDASGVKTRLKGKIEQTQEGNSNLPALATVVGFRARLIVIRMVEQSS
jgi:hypothetical protein